MSNLTQVGFAIRVWRNTNTLGFVFDCETTNMARGISVTGLHAVLDKEKIARSQISYRNLISSHHYQRLNSEEKDIVTFYDRHGSSLETWALNGKAWQIIDSAAKQGGLPTEFILLWEREPIGQKGSIIYLNIDGLSQVVTVDRFQQNFLISSNWLARHVAKF